MDNSHSRNASFLHIGCAVFTSGSHQRSFSFSHFGFAILFLIGTGTETIVYINADVQPVKVWRWYGRGSSGPFPGIHFYEPWPVYVLKVCT